MQLVKFESALEIIKRGEKLPNGIYGALSKEEKKQIREMRLSTAIEMTPRMLSAEMVQGGWKAERVEKQILKGGVEKVVLQVLKRPQAKVDVSNLSDDELMAEIERRKATKN